MNWSLKYFVMISPRWYFEAIQTLLAWGRREANSNNCSNLGRS